MSMQIRNPNRYRRMRKLLRLQGGMCSLCGEKVADADATFDHIIPRSRGGSNALENLAIAHRWCNGNKGNLIEEADIAAALKTAVRRATTSDINRAVLLARAAQKKSTPKRKHRDRIEVVNDVLKQHPEGAAETVIAMESGVALNIAHRVLRWMETQKLVTVCRPDDPVARCDLRAWKWKLT